MYLTTKPNQAGKGADSLEPQKNTMSSGGVQGDVQNQTENCGVHISSECQVWLLSD